MSLALIIFNYCIRQFDDLFFSNCQIKKDKLSIKAKFATQKIYYKWRL